ncbi:conserved hypothetical protein [Talaromyces stipitatus ATCC 10500]|uniref:C6 transcription factor n=1 Tax=Talaromyces stipitatus (strain ATCC 10500 / CBS 375.48 / QM 6759 / NRRL 1006) TaxID=441959 RepID=B8LYT3_TALSN|nr:uncharacterized protein TSTA_068640 [Talaromyces stipitatus ATCC 10500]EED23441.1 conserved hypothetical protein [Talaromyces stipitatus ATCC 10500]
MVNYGVSRACETCRNGERRSGRVCLGYRSNDELRFHHHIVTMNVPVQSFPISEGSIAEDAVGFFLNQYVVYSTDPRVSRGFLDGLPSLLSNAHRSSNLVQAVEIVAWTSIGIQLARPESLVRARREYVLLQSCQTHAPTVEALVIAILLDLYEIVSGGEISSEQQSMLPMSGESNPLGTLQELQTTLDCALAIELAFSLWNVNLDPSWKAHIVGHITQTDAEASSCPFARSDPVHTYFDIYVAAVMNTYRKTYLMLLDISIHLASRIEESIQTNIVMGWEQQVHILINDIIASVLYHLTNNLHDYLQAIISSSKSPGIGRSVEGLLLLHHLYVLSTCSIVSSLIRSYARKCPAWSWRHMRIGQGTLMSKQREKKKPLPSENRTAHAPNKEG